MRSKPERTAGELVVTWTRRGKFWSGDPGRDNHGCVGSMRSGQLAGVGSSQLTQTIDLCLPRQRATIA